MRPSFSIIANGQDISGEITRRLVSMDIVDTVDETSDGITIVLEDTTKSLALPKSRDQSISPCSGPQRAASSSTRRVTAGSSSSGGAMCGFSRASITSGPRQPQCLRRVNAPTPATSAAGFDRVNVTHSQSPSDRAAIQRVQ